MIIFFEESPEENTSRSEPLSPYFPGSTGEQLQKLSGLSKQEYCDRFMRLNLLDQINGEWPKQKAKEIASSYLDAGYAFNDKVTVVLLGRRVAHAFGLFEAPFFEKQTIGGFTLFVMPRPSAQNIWYSDENNTRQCELFLKDLMRKEELRDGVRVVYRPSHEPSA